MNGPDETELGHPRGKAILLMSGVFLAVVILAVISTITHG